MSTALDFAERLKQKRSRDARGQSVATRFTKAEQSELDRAATAAGQPLREWLRDTLLREARRSKTDPILTEIIANRMLLINVLRPLIAGQKMSGERFDELLTAIKAGKRNAAQEVLEQYAVELPQEASDGK